MSVDADRIKLTYDDLLTMPHDGRRHEIIDGCHVVNAAPVPRHQLVTGAIYRQLAGAIHDRGRGTVFVSPIDVELSTFDIVSPDIVVLIGDDRGRVAKSRIVGVPDLVVETLSESTRRYDERTKRALYERAGIREYWLVDPGTGEIDRLTLEESTYRAETIRGATLDVWVAPGVTIDLGRVFEA